MIALDRLSVITDPNIALANKAFAVALGQVTGIMYMSLPQFAVTVGAQRTTANLPLIAAQTTPVPAAVANNVVAALGTGTGPNGTITIEDILGTGAGVTANAIVNTVSIINSMNTADLTSTYTTMFGVVNGDYGDPVTGPVDILSGPYTGTYADANDAFGNVLISGAQSDIANLVSVYPTQVSTLNTNFANVSQHIQTEKTNQAAAKIDFTQTIANDRSSIYSFVFSLPNYGDDVDQGDTQQYIQDTVDLSTYGGQAIIATMRQGSNDTVLNNNGVGIATAIPDNTVPPPPVAPLVPGN